jgi:mono/diheme cytochrome c family protein
MSSSGGWVTSGRAAVISAGIAALVVAVTLFGAGPLGSGAYDQNWKAVQEKAPPADKVAVGRKVFFNNCAHCHGQDADGGEDAPSLRKLAISDTHVVLILKNGIKDEMPSFADKINDEQIAGVTAYLRTLK